MHDVSPQNSRWLRCCSLGSRGFEYLHRGGLTREQVACRESDEPHALRGSHPVDRWIDLGSSQIA